MHGTWAAPQPDKALWYQPSDSASATDQFVSKLDAALRKRGSPARCWAHCTDGTSFFHWNGENSWIARTHAAAALADYVARLQNDNWICHIVAHSHGGNVALDALQQITTPAEIHKSCGKLVTVGTPFLDTTSPIAKSAYRLRRFLNIMQVMVAIFCAFFVGAAYLSLFWINTKAIFEEFMFAVFGGALDS